MEITLILAAIPFVVYFSVKFGMYAFLRALDLYRFEKESLYGAESEEEKTGPTKGVGQGDSREE